MSLAATLKTDCGACGHKRSVPGNAHIQCARPDADMRGSPHGVRNGWFFYPLLFDPIWRTRECANFEARDAGATGTP